MTFSAYRITRSSLFILTAIFSLQFFSMTAYAESPAAATAGAEETRFKEEARAVQAAQKTFEEEPKEEKPLVEQETSEDLGPAFIIDEKKKEDPTFEGLVGLPLLNRLENQKKAASKKLDFEKAALFRDKIKTLKQNEEYRQLAEVQDQMNKAADSDDFEHAVELREELFRLQKKIETPKPEPKFRVQSIRIVGNTMLPVEQLVQFTEPLINQDVTLSDVQKSARDIKNYYRSQGYVAAFAYVPEQSVKDGVVELRIIEGAIGNIEIAGNQYYSTELIKRHIKLKPGEIVQYDALRRSILNIDKHRDLDAKAILRPGLQPMTTDVLVKVEDRRPFHLSVDTNNYGTRLTGKERWGATLSHSNLLGAMDEAIFRFSAGDGSYSVGGDYSYPVIWDTTRLGFAFSRGDVDLVGDFKALNVEGISTTYSPYIKHRFFDRDRPYGPIESFTGDLKLSYDHKTVENRALDVETGQDDIRLISTALVFEESDRYGKTFFPQSLHFASPDFGGTHKNDEALTRAHTGAPFTIYRGSVDRYQYLPYNSMLVLHSAWQLADDKLPPSEQFQLGGINSVRGYPQGEFLGDYGATFSAELLVPAFFVDKNWRLPNSKSTLRDDTRFLVFFDYGMANLKGTLPGELESKDLSSIGVGLRMKVYDKAYVRLEYGYPMQEKPSDSQSGNGTFYYGFSMDLL